MHLGVADEFLCCVYFSALTELVLWTYCIVLTVVIIVLLDHFDADYCISQSIKNTFICLTPPEYISVVQFACLRNISSVLGFDSEVNWN